MKYFKYKLHNMTMAAVLSAGSAKYRKRPKITGLEEETVIHLFLNCN